MTDSIGKPTTTPALGSGKLQDDKTIDSDQQNIKKSAANKTSTRTTSNKISVDTSAIGTATDKHLAGITDDDNKPQLAGPRTASDDGELGYQELIAIIEDMVKRTTISYNEALQQVSRASNSVMQVLSEEHKDALIKHAEDLEHQKEAQKLKGIFAVIAMAVGFLLAGATGGASAVIAMAAVTTVLLVLTTPIVEVDNGGLDSQKVTLLQLMCLEITEAIEGRELTPQERKDALLAGSILAVVLQLAAVAVPVVGASKGMSKSTRKLMAFLERKSKKAASLAKSTSKALGSTKAQYAAQGMNATVGLVSSATSMNLTAAKYKSLLSSTRVQINQAQLDDIKETLRRQQLASEAMMQDIQEAIELMKRIVDSSNQTLSSTANFS